MYVNYIFFYCVIDKVTLRTNGKNRVKIILPGTLVMQCDLC